MEYFTKKGSNSLFANRIDGVFKLGENWAIPDNAEKPIDNRKKGNK